jgi:hypothetical protein
MPRQANIGGGAPFAKFVNLGDTLIGAWGGAMQRQAYDYDTRKPAFRRDDPTKPLREEINWFVAMDGTTAATGSDGDFASIEPGSVVRFSFMGFKWNQVIKAREVLAAMPEFKIAKGREAYGDVYTIALAGWSAETKNPDAARKAGFTVAENRIVLRTPEQKDQYVLHQSRSGGNTNPAKDLTVTVRRIDLPNEAKWDELADALASTEPWKVQAAPAGEGYVDDGAPHPADGPAPSFDPNEEPF